MTASVETRFRDLLVHDHARLDSMLGALLECVRADAQPEMERAWSDYEESLLAHLDAEEMFLLPGLAAHDPGLASSIRDEHAVIRSTLAEVGVGLELHIVRDEHMRELARFLRAHARIEEASLYLWAGASLTASHLSSVRRRLRATWSGTVAPPASSERRPTAMR